MRYRFRQRLYLLAQAGTVFHLSLEAIRRCITDAGYTPRQRNVFYEYLDEAPAGMEAADDPADGLTRSIDLGVQLPVVM